MIIFRSDVYFAISFPTYENSFINWSRMYTSIVRFETKLVYIIALYSWHSRSHQGYRTKHRAAHSLTTSTCATANAPISAWIERSNQNFKSRAVMKVLFIQYQRATCLHSHPIDTSAMLPTTPVNSYNATRLGVFRQIHSALHSAPTSSASLTATRILCNTRKRTRCPLLNQHWSRNIVRLRTPGYKATSARCAQRWFPVH